METASKTKIALPLCTHLLVFAIRHVIKIRFRPLCRGATWQAAAANFPDRLRGSVRCVALLSRYIPFASHCIALHCRILSRADNLSAAVSHARAALGSIRVLGTSTSVDAASIMLQSLRNLRNTYIVPHLAPSILASPTTPRCIHSISHRFGQQHCHSNAFHDHGSRLYRLT